MLFCPCGIKERYEKCCGLYISGQQLPKTAEALMRSRYTAYTHANISYIQSTMKGKASEGFDPLESEKWAKTAKWKRLRVLEVFPHQTDKNFYYVKFMAYYIWQGKPHQLIETSEFERVDEKWFYIGSV